MAGFSYSGDPSSSGKDEVRFLVGDTVPDDPLLSDPEIEALLSDFSTPLAAAAEAARRIAALKSRLADKSVDGLSISYSQQSANYHKLAQSLTSRAATSSATVNVPRMVFTGTSTLPRLRLGQTGYPWSPVPEWVSPFIPEP